jgi:hypothetical protein
LLRMGCFCDCIVWWYIIYININKAEFGGVCVCACVRVRMRVCVCDRETSASFV